MTEEILAVEELERSPSTIEKLKNFLSGRGNEYMNHHKKEIGAFGFFIGGLIGGLVTYLIGYYINNDAGNSC